MSVMMKLPEKYEENSKVFCQEVTVIACSISSYLSVSSVHHINRLAKAVMQKPVVLQKSFAVQIYIQLCILMNTFSLYCCIYMLEVA